MTQDAGQAESGQRVGGLGFHLLPDPFPETGPDVDQLADWSATLRNGSTDLRAQSHTLLRTITTELEWGGAAAGTYRRRVTEAALVLVGVAEGMDAVAKVLDTYAAAGRVWNDQIAAATRLDDEGVGHDYQFLAAVQRAAEADGVADTEYAPEILWPDHPELVAIAGQPDPPEALSLYNSPQKLQAKAAADAALRVLVEAGLVAAHQIELVHEQMTTGPDGSYQEPFDGLRALGIAVFRFHQQPFGPAGSVEAGDPESDDESWKHVMEALLSGHDLEEGSSELAKNMRNLLQPFEDETMSQAAEASARALGVLGFLGDLGTIMHNDEEGWHKAFTDMSATANAAAVATDLAGMEAMDASAAALAGDWEIPGVDLATTAVLVATSIYSLGNLIYDHGHPPHAELP